MHTVGDKRQRAPLVNVSSPNASPIRRAISVSNVDAMLQAAGKQAAVLSPLILLPRAPFGPSVVCDSYQTRYGRKPLSRYLYAWNTFVLNGSSKPHISTSQ